MSADVEAYLARHEQKELLRFVTVGSVDDGKSTLIGRLLHDTHGIYEDQLAAVARASKKHGTTGDAIDLALLTDGLKAEREQGITIDVAYRYFSTEKRKFIIADTPGHVQYTRNMATGASTAHVAIILIDARHGVLQQSRRHAYLASLLGIPYLAVCVNKMDLVDFQASAFDAVVRELSAFASQLRFEAVRFFPISAVRGDNVVHASPALESYRGGTLLHFLETVPILDTRGASPLRFPVQYVLRPNLAYRGFAGQLASGTVKVGDAVLALPSGKRSTVASIDAFEGPLELAFAPMSTTLRLADEIDLSRGDMLVHAESSPTATCRFEATLVWMNERPLELDKSYFLKHTTRLVRATVEALAGRVDLESLAEVSAPTLGLNDIGRVTVASNQPLFVDAYVDNRQTGAFVLIDALTNETVGAGMIARALEARPASLATRDPSLVALGEREARLGQRARLVWFSGERAPSQPALAYALERRLFDLGRVATVIDVDAVTNTTRSPLLAADLVEQCLHTGAITILSCALGRAAEREHLAERVEATRRVDLASLTSVPDATRRVDLASLARAAEADAAAAELAHAAGASAPNAVAAPAAERSADELRAEVDRAIDLLREAGAFRA